MAFTKELPQWDNAGQKPPQSKISEGFKPMDHPPADWFNWYMNRTYEALNELQSEAATTTEVTAGLKVLSNDITAHSNAKNNPHAVTKSQVGLGDVDNIKQASKVDFDNHVNDQDLHISSADKEKWNRAQLAKLTLDNGRVFYRGSAEVTDYNTVTQTGMYLIYNAGLNGPPSFNLVFLLVMSYGNTLAQIAYESSKGKQAYFRFRKSDSETWTTWERQLTASDLDVVWNIPTLQPGWKQYAPADGSIHTVRFSKDASGVVEIKGAVYGGVLGLDTPVFTLPVGYRPMQSEYFPGIASSVGTPGVPQTHRTFIGTDGRVCIQSSSNTSNPVEFLSFGFRFRTR
ncbi:hypothetical protein Saga11_23010 [Bacillus safensis]|nr:hypothetical protein Saga11_23010 [Bacillus safensis]